MKTTRHDNHGWRKFKSSLASILSTLAALLVIAPLGLVFLSPAKGAGTVNWDFFKQLPKPVGEVGGGMANAIVGTLQLLGIASLIGIPIGVLGGVFLSEYGNAASNWWLRFVADVLNGVPSITWGVVVYGLVVLQFKSFSAYAGGLALGFMMIPLIMRTTEEVLLLVPNGYREASLALGISRWRTIVHIVMKTASKGIITGILLALARIAGETARSFSRPSAIAFGIAILRSRSPRFRYRSSPMPSRPTPIGIARLGPAHSFWWQEFSSSRSRPGSSLATGERESYKIMSVTKMSSPQHSSPREAITPRQPPAPAPSADGTAFGVKNLSIWYGEKLAVKEVTIALPAKSITAIIGPSGCGKSTFLRCLNRKHELVPRTRVEGQILFYGEDLYAAGIDPAMVRRRVGMVFQKSIPFPPCRSRKTCSLG